MQGDRHRPAPPYERPRLSSIGCFSPVAGGAGSLNWANPTAYPSKAAPALTGIGGAALFGGLYLFSEVRTILTETVFVVAR